VQSTVPILTVDGPSGVGKGTVSRIVSQKMGWHLLDSGAIYRAFALAVNQQGVDIEDEDGLENLAKTLNLEFRTEPGKELVSVYLDAQEVSKQLRTEATGEMASKIATIAIVRKALLERQRAFAKPPGLVADGRDMGTQVFANAPFKVYLTASAEERANRRLKQLQSAGSKGIIAQILQEVKKRDERDSTRKSSPLKPAEDALIIDTTDLSIDEVIAKVMTLIEA